MADFLQEHALCTQQIERMFRAPATHLAYSSQRGLWPQPKLRIRLAARYQRSAISGQLLNQHREHPLDFGDFLRQFLIAAGCDLDRAFGQSSKIRRPLLFAGLAPSAQSLRQED
jgi:hypothetical protein